MSESAHCSYDLLSEALTELSPALAALLSLRADRRPARWSDLFLVMDKDMILRRQLDSVGRVEALACRLRTVNGRDLHVTLDAVAEPAADGRRMVHLTMTPAAAPAAPTAPTPIPELKPQPAPPPPHHHTPARAKGVRILFIDDEAFMLRAAIDLLTELGYSVKAFQDPHDALIQLHDHPGDFDLVMTDHSMPDMTGVEAARRVRAIRADLPVVLCTGYNLPLTAEKARELGIRAMIMKPFDLESLGRVLDSVLLEKPV